MLLARAPAIGNNPLRQPLPKRSPSAQADGFSRYHEGKETPRLALAAPLCHDGDSQCGSTQGQGRKGARSLITGLGQLGGYLLLSGLGLGLRLRLRLVLRSSHLVRIRDDALVADSSVVGSIAIDVCLGDPASTS